jgi:hypothetical protein
VQGSSRQKKEEEVDGDGVVERGDADAFSVLLLCLRAFASLYGRGKKTMKKRTFP